MATSIQVVFDCADPDRLADFWAAALGYVKQPAPAGFASWEAFLEANHVPREEWGAASAIVDPDGKGPRIYFQRMDTPKPAKNRIHMDLNASRGPAADLADRKRQVGAEARRIQELGATRLRVEEDGPQFWIVLADPEGNEFCIQ